MSDDEHTLVPRRPEVIPPGQYNPFSNLAESFGTAINTIMQNSGINFRGIPRGPSYDDLPPEDQKIIDAMMEKLEPELEEKAKALLAAEIRDRIARQGDFVQLGKMLKKGKKVTIKRKTGCIYLQFGTGEATDPIDEFLVAST